jgi:hypothetical protein
MKKHVIYILLAIIGFVASCKKDEDPKLDDPDKRIAAELATKQADLLAAPNGWRATIYPKGGKGFMYYFKFNADGTVKMLSDFNTSTAVAVAESTYRLKALMRPTLIFDGYSYIHLPADPNGSVSGGSNATGLRSDFEFAFTKTTKDSIYFDGIFNENKFVMTKLSAAEEQQFLAGALKPLMDDATAATSGKILFILLDGKQVPVSLSVANKSINIAGKTSSAFSFALDGLELKSPLKINDYTFNKVYWDNTNKQFYLMNGTNKIVIQISLSPLPLEETPELHTQLVTRWASMQVNMATMPDQSNAFKTAYNTSNTSLGTLGNAGRYIEYITIFFNANSTINFQIRYRNPSNPTSFFNADFNYTMNLNSTTGVATFTQLGTPSGNAATIATYVVALRNYIANNSFKIAYISAAAPAGAKVGGFLSQNDPASFFYGTLSQ